MPKMRSRLFSLAVITLVLSYVLVEQANADPGNLPISYASKGNFAHSCVKIGADSQYVGVVC